MGQCQNGSGANKNPGTICLHKFTGHNVNRLCPDIEQRFRQIVGCDDGICDGLNGSLLAPACQSGSGNKQRRHSHTEVACLDGLGLEIEANAFAAPAQPLLTDKKELSAYAARKMIEACQAQAQREGYPIALAVTDSAGNLLSYQTMDGATDNTGLTAQLKAKTAAVFRRDTADLAERVNKHVNRAPEWMGYFPIPGGYPVVVQGEVVGAGTPNAFEGELLAVEPQGPEAVLTIQFGESLLKFVVATKNVPKTSGKIALAPHANLLAVFDAKSGVRLMGGAVS